MTRKEIQDFAFEAKWILSDMKEIICAWHMEELETWMCGCATLEELHNLGALEQKRLNLVSEIHSEIEVRVRQFRIDLLKAIEE